uniref:CRAL-TRIO domain-containing protein n=1 Tax=Polytomella parva TaxID=51329 RepID=A0A7S0VKM8_9CHLO|mmetsp:Transcript_6255/g.12049  ORF Transcript_6255/g.12049 Transcript_6255/m.12049 type:complete len:260 (+) Transcript_6255:104-883(+)|eukprot:CAMPEP_0175079636 /NCGR_PEP_ID=MMETSP0052_2-20121109/24940_1 /TAXON_ID=51329 ORGANISM="Polytomella parva, Strain SAG 63-3" /NCGR_SAMPLE_ID=MMETSP0052_2 /ASSEMBLY_ACC=CAM_ASM_000194 /LENGTH=259 /DNA_ID=CAMNT_0016350003 /DNA_START=94 /DNA_END=873 /DNA_ORIENTATION=+
MLDADTQLQRINELKNKTSHQVLLSLKDGGEKHLEGIYERWLKARNWNVDHAARDLTNHSAWRKTYVPKGHITDDEVRGDLNQQKTFLTGYDFQGHPIMLVIIRKHIPSESQSKRYIVYTMDTAFELGTRIPNWDGKLAGIFDLRGLTMANFDLETIKAVFDLLQNHYPERLDRLYIYGAPFIFHGMWRLIQPFVDPITRAKIRFVGVKELQVMTKDFPPKALPPEYGGSGMWIPVEGLRKQLEDGSFTVDSAVRSNNR